MRTAGEGAGRGPLQRLAIAAEHVQLGCHGRGHVAQQVPDQILGDGHRLIAGRARNLDVNLVELHEVAARRGSLERLKPDVWRDEENLVERGKGRLLVQDRARHEFVTVAVIIDVHLFGSARAWVSHRSDDRRQQFGEAGAGQMLADRAQDPLLDP